MGGDIEVSVVELEVWLSPSVDFTLIELVEVDGETSIMDDWAFVLPDVPDGSTREEVVGNVEVFGPSRVPEFDLVLRVAGLEVPISVHVIVRLSVVESPDSLPINGPNDPILVPIDRVCVELSLRLPDVHRCASVIPSRNTFPEIVCLYLALRVGVSEVIAGPFPVNLVEIIRHEDCIADYSYAGRGLHDNIDLPEKYVRIRPDLYGIMALLECEFSAVRSESNLCAV